MALKVRPVDPLQKNVPIVDAHGLPTPYFLRQWTLARVVNLTTDDLTVSVAELQELLTSLQQLQQDLQAALDALESRAITAGVGLTGGGDLSASRTIDLEDTAVTPGTYGSATHVPQITVDQQGRITNVVEVAL